MAEQFLHEMEQELFSPASSPSSPRGHMSPPLPASIAATLESFPEPSEEEKAVIEQIKGILRDRPMLLATLGSRLIALRVSVKQFGYPKLTNFLDRHQKIFSLTASKRSDWIVGLVSDRKNSLYQQLEPHTESNRIQKHGYDHENGSSLSWKHQRYSSSDHSRAQNNSTDLLTNSEDRPTNSSSNEQQQSQHYSKSTKHHKPVVPIETVQDYIRYQLQLAGPMGLRVGSLERRIADAGIVMFTYGFDNVRHFIESKPDLFRIEYTDKANSDHWLVYAIMPNISLPQQQQPQSIAI